MDERMKRKYTEMVFHFFQEYFPGTRIYEGKFIKNIAIVRDLRTDRTELVRDFKIYFGPGPVRGFIFAETASVSNAEWSENQSID